MYTYASSKKAAADERPRRREAGRGGTEAKPSIGERQAGPK
jgi:hypothetical protein